eukprot:6934874-Pyramimonas_sp.AAC.1
MGQSIDTARPRLPKMASRTTTMASKFAQDGPRYNQGRPEEVHNASGSAQEAPQTAQGDPNVPQ